MTKQEWFIEANGSRDKVKSLIRDYHPIYRQAGRRRNIDFITAPNAEAACTIVRKQIQDSTPEGFNPVDEYQKALDKQDIDMAMKILNEVWFGVPESTTCWQLTGFREAVDLMDDPPEEKENEKD